MDTNKNLSNNPESTHKLLKTIVFSAVIVALLLVAGYFYFSGQQKVQSYEFTGNLKEIDGNNLVIEGLFIDDANNPIGSSPAIIKAEVSADTKITRESFDLPTTGEMFEVDKLPLEIETVDLDTIKQDINRNTIGIRVKSNTDIYGKEQFTASEITYRLPK